MKILQLCHKVPFPAKDGGSMAITNLTQGLTKEGNTVKLLAINTKKHFVDIEQLPAEYHSETGIEAVFVDTDVKAGAAFANLFSDDSYNITRFYSPEFENKLIEVLKSQRFDIVQLESLYVSMYTDTIRKYSNAKIVLRAHNIEHQIWELAAQLSNNPLKKIYLQLLAKRLKKYELNKLKSFDGIAAITKSDEAFFKKSGFSKPTLTVPFGIEMNDTVESVPEEYPSLFHIGAMDWQPNIEGITWFLNDVWNKIHAKHPHLKLYLAGRNMQKSEWEQLNKPNVIIVGEVDNAQQFILSKGILLVPLLSGGGMRVKIIEGLSLGKTIISTKTGAEGVECENNKHLFIANTADEFVEAISKCVSDKKLYLEIGQNARRLAIEKYNNVGICKNLIAFYKTIVTN